LSTFRRLSALNGRLAPRLGSSGSALAAGVRHYLWHHANASFSWWGDNLANLPTEDSGAPLPAPPRTKVRRSTTLKYRMAMNSCAFGYSTPYWNLTRWVREIDRMALRGVNVVNQHEGGAWVHQQVFLQLGLSEAEIPFPGASGGQVGPSRIVALYDRPSTFIPDPLTYSVPPFLKRQCDRTLRPGLRGHGRAAAAELHRLGAFLSHPIHAVTGLFHRTPAYKRHTNII
jgi:hypothetical protein